MPKITAKFMKSHIKPPEQGQLIIRDSELKGFGLRVTKGSMSYIAECRVNGRAKRITISNCDLLTPENARKEARKLLGEMAAGSLPVRSKSRLPTLNEVLDAFLAARNLRPSSVRHYKAILHRCLSDWLDLRIDKITKEMVLQRHKDLTKTTRQKTDGRAQANKALENLRVLLNFANDSYETSNGNPVLPVNPVMALNRHRSWHKAKQRQRIIPDAKFPLWCVFPGRDGKKHMVDSTHVIAQIPHRIGCPFVLHDLRRCFLSRGERLGLSYFTLRRLANHGYARDITAGYIVFDVEQLREPMQRITDEFLMLMGCNKDDWKV